MNTVLRLKSKSASKEKRRRDLFVVVHTVPGTDPERFVGAPHTREEALRVFAGVLRSAPTGFFSTNKGAYMRVVSVKDWNQARVAEAVLES